MYLLWAQRLHTLNPRDESWPTMRKISERIGASKSAVQDAIKKLQATRSRQDRARPLQRLLAGYGDAITKRRKRAGLK